MCHLSFFLTVFTVPIKPLICFSLMKGDKDVIGFSQVDLIVINVGHFS